MCKPIFSDKTSAPGSGGEGTDLLVPLDRPIVLIKYKQFITGQMGHIGLNKVHTFNNPGPSQAISPS